MPKPDLNTEEVLAEHEAEKQRLNDEKETKTPILTRLRKYFELLDEAAQLEVRRFAFPSIKTSRNLILYVPHFRPA